MKKDNRKILDTVWYSSRAIPPEFDDKGSEFKVGRYFQAWAVLIFDDITKQFKAYIWVWIKMDEYEDGLHIAKFGNKINKATALAIFWNYIIIELWIELNDNYAY